MDWRHFISRGVSEVFALRAIQQPSSGFRILLYHSVGPRTMQNHYGLSVASERFRCQMTALRDMPEVKTVPLEQYGRFASDGLCAGISFDDGYRNNLTQAAPILVELGLPFSVFIVPSYLDDSDHVYLTTRELRELSAMPGCAIGSHTMTHQQLTHLDDAALARELSDSRNWLEQQLGRQVTMLSYPHGSADKRVRDAAATVGYTLGVCSRTGINSFDRDPLLLCRTEIRAADSVRFFQQKVLGSWDWHRLRHGDPAESANVTP